MTAADRSRLLRGARLSIRILLAHPLRTALSVSGLLVGVSAVMLMSAVGSGAERRVLAQVRAMGTDLLVVTGAPAPRVAGRERQAAGVTLLRPADAEVIAAEAFLARAAAPAVSRPMVARWEGRNVPTTLFGTSQEGLAIRGLRAAAGRLFDEGESRERRRVAMLGPVLARTLFGETDPVGQELRLGNVPIEVIGILAARGTDVAGADLDDVVVVPLETAMRRILNIPYVHAVYVQGRPGADLSALELEVREVLGQRHPARAGTPEPFLVQNQAVLLRTERGAARAFNRLIVATGLLALLVGGVGILAIMQLSVRERVREIGLRRAVGARSRDIQLQFLLESGLVSAAGGVAGVTAGLAVTAVAALVGPWDLVLPWRAALGGLGCSVGIGLLVGTIPAARAGRLPPIEALSAA